MTKRIAVVFAVVAAFAACDEKKPTSTSAPSATANPTATATANPAATPTVTSTTTSTAHATATAPATPHPLPTIPDASTFGAANAADVARYPNEKPVADADDKIAHDMRVRTVPSTKEGDVILALRAGVPVKKVAKRGQWFLITFADPKDKSRTLLGWTWDQAFVHEAGPGEDACAADERIVTSQGFCAKTCKTNASCPNDYVCTDTMGTPSVCVRAKIAE